MINVMFFIDGFNVYHALDDNPNYHKYKWLDFSKLAQCYITNKEKIVDVLYFTAYATWAPNKVSRHRVLVRALATKNVKTILGRFKAKEKRCKAKCKLTYWTHEEKETDVNIAVYLFQAAVKNEFDSAIIMSGDSDLVPAVRGIKSTFSTKRIGVVIPINRYGEDMKKICHFHKQMKEDHLKASLLPDRINLGGGKYLVRPQEWT